MTTSLHENYTAKECKSGLHHEWGIDDGVLHYIGCLRFDEREIFLDALPDDDKLKKAIIEEEKSIQGLRRVFEHEAHDSENGKLLENFKDALVQVFPAHVSPPPSSFSIQSNTIDMNQNGDEVALGDLNANIMYFKNNRPYDHPKFPGTFPNQKVSLSLLLEKNVERNPLMWRCEPDMIRYFHVPANNMSWMEDVIARYYSEDKPDLDGPYVKPKKGEPKSKTRMLLRPQYWRGLQHGNRKDLPTHTRHMRPRSYVISTDHENIDLKPKNIVLFMPYLHWETDRRRARAADVIKETSKAKMAALDDVVLATEYRVIEGTFERVTSDGFPEPSLRRKGRPRLPSFSNPSIPPPKRVQGRKLGRFLFNAAALFEAMDSYTDEKLIHNYLTTSPPLHPRRTLDQSYYSTLKDTRKRDRDQVVYRGTAPNPKVMHYGCQKKKCPQCLEDVTKVPRIIMVDQLWMWVLDENTIISSFPKRWGHNKPDHSAIQKCLRTRLRSARDDEVRCVFDLAIIIIDQCTRVFFDRTLSVDLQPQMMDSFANAIGRVSHKCTIAFDHFWECTRLTSKRYSAQEQGEPETLFAQKMQTTLLDINPEGDLLREIKDIMDELFIITTIKQQEENVARTFVKLARNITQSGNGSLRSRSETNSSDVRRSRPSLTNEQRKSSLVMEMADQQEIGWASTWLVTDVLESIQDQLIELEYLRQAADNASMALKDLLSLKQQQAGVVEARESVKQGEETLRQGRSIMLFTIVTIIFLPLSFFTGIFGMNATELTGQSGDYRFRDIFVYMVPISFVVITGSLFLAFSKLVRALLSFGFHFAWAYLITFTRLYVRWHDTHLNSKRLNEQEKALVNEMKARALREDAEKKLAVKERMIELANAAAKVREEEEERVRASATVNGVGRVREHGLRNGMANGRDVLRKPGQIR